MKSQRMALSKSIRKQLLAGPAMKVKENNRGGENMAKAKLPAAKKRKASQGENRER
jgi:hypothetical protein